MSPPLASLPRRKNALFTKTTLLAVITLMKQLNAK